MKLGSKVLVGVVGAACVAGCGSDEPGGDKSAASVMCEKFVKQKLKSPGSAKFQSFLDQDISFNETAGTYMVRSHVDSDNSLGVSVRKTYRCVVKSADGDKWELVELTGLDR